MGLFKKKDFRTLEPWVVHLQGLPNLKIMNCRVKCDDEYLIISTMRGGILKPKKVDTVYKILIDKVISLDMLSDSTAEVKSKSIIGNGIPGRIIYGPAVVFLNGNAEIALIHDTKPKYVLNLAYYGDSENDIKVIVFNADHETFRNMDFVEGFRNMYLKEDVESNEAGEILL